MQRRVAQPATISYPDQSRRYVVVKQRGSAAEWFRLEITGSDPTRFVVEWTAEGALITFDSGHELLVPARAFTGGR